MTAKLFYWSVMLFSFYFLSSCSDNSKKRFIIGVSQCSDDEWRDKLNHEIAQEAMYRGNIDVIFKTANDNNQKQIKDIDELIAQNIDLLIVSPNESAPITKAVEKAFDHNIPVIVSDREIRSEKYTAYIGPDNYEIGVLAGNFIVDFLKGKGNIVEIKGTEGASPTIERHKGFMSVVENYEMIKVIYSESGSFLEKAGEKKMQDALNLYNDIDLVFCHNDRMAKGAYRAAKVRGRERDITFVGIDALAEDGYGVDMVLNGMLKATFVNATGGDKIMDLAMNILHGKTVMRKTTLPTTQVDSRNAKILKLQSDYANEQNNKITVLNRRVHQSLIKYNRQQIFLYCILVITLLMFLCLYLLFKTLEKKKLHNLELSKKNDEIMAQKRQIELQKEQIEKAMHSKLHFYVNVSHDFLTPLTLIIEAIKQVVINSNLKEEEYNLLIIAKRNSLILHRLVKQLLDFRSFEEGQLTLNLSKINLQECIQEWSNCFLPSAKRKGIKLICNIIPDNYCDMNVDYGKIERLFYNILSNALEFTRQGGTVSVFLCNKCENSEKKAIIKITDTGIGISSEQVNDIFNPFYKENNDSPGTGIGLAVAKAFAELHNGNILVESKVGQGTTFTIILPYSQSGHISLSIPATTKNNPIEQQMEIDFNILNQPLPEGEKKMPVVLVADDNADMLYFLYQQLKKEYLVLAAKDGQYCLKLAMQHVPNIIIADIMMPVMDGFELCRHLKSDPRTKHIPVILLSALTLDNYKIKGLNNGADIYIEKPFETAILLGYINNLINKSQTQQNFSHDEKYMNINHQSFMDKIYSLFEEHLDDSEFNVETLGAFIGLSRVQLYRKIREATNYTPNELLKNYRLQKAKSLLLTTDLGVAEISYRVGFASPAYFTKCYHKLYGEPPTTLLKRLGKM